MKIKFGAIIVAGSGKIGGHVASKNRSGAYLRTKVTPTNPNTLAQQQSRSILTSLSRAWGDLDDDQRNGWNGAVAQWSKTDIFGDIKNPSGINLYVRLNAILLSVGLVAVENVPEKTSTNFEPISTVFMDISASTGQLTLAGGSIDGKILAIDATPQLGRGVSFAKSEFRRIGASVVVNSGVDIWNSYIFKFGIPSVGANIFFRARVVEPNGQVSGFSQVKVLVTA